MSNLEELLETIKEFGVGKRHPHDPFFNESNECCQPLRTFGIVDYDDEEFYHKPYKAFSCHIPGCEKTFETIIQYESHYNSCHCFTCNECSKNFPNNHLLDLHLSESHDSFFIEQAKRKPMFQCFVEECKELFQNSELRRDHCIKIHQYPCDFRFDSSRKQLKKSKKKIHKGQNNSEKMDVVESSESGPSQNLKEVKKDSFKGFTFGHSQSKSKRKPVFHDFSKDLLNSLPDS